MIIEGSPLAKKLADTGVELKPGDKKGFVTLTNLDSKLFAWDHAAAAAAATTV